MASSSKILRLCNQDLQDDIFNRFSEETKALQTLQMALQELSSKAGAVASLTIMQCNAAFGKHGSFGKSFSEADVELKPNVNSQDAIFSFGEIFSRGFDLLHSYLDNPKVAPSEKHMEIILRRLLNYLLDKDDPEALKSKRIKRSECDLAARYAVHLFSKLSVSSAYTIDQHYHGSETLDSCGCGCKSVISYGDTSIGNLKVWHGCLDILLSSSDLPITVVEKPKLGSPGGKSLIEITASDNLEDFEDEKTASQIVAETVVFSFTQKMIHPEYSNFLIPSIGVSKNKIVFHFYDSEHDLLFKSESHDIFDMTGKIRVFTILATWFVVNYKYLCPGPSERILNKAKKANFFELADAQLPIYKENLTIGGINFESYEKSTVSFNLSNLVEIDFLDPYAELW